MADIAVGDRSAGTPDGRQSWEVAALEPGRFLGLRMSLDLPGRPFDPAGTTRPEAYIDSLWGFLLKELPGSRTRLIVSGYWALRPGWLPPIISFFLLEPSLWIMQTRQFQNLKRRTERDPAGRHGLSHCTNYQSVLSTDEISYSPPMVKAWRGEKV